VNPFSIAISGWRRWSRFTQLAPVGVHRASSRASGDRAPPRSSAISISVALRVYVAPSPQYDARFICSAASK